MDSLKNWPTVGFLEDAWELFILASFIKTVPCASPLSLSRPPLCSIKLLIFSQILFCIIRALSRNLKIKRCELVRSSSIGSRMRSRIRPSQRSSWFSLSGHPFYLLLFIFLFFQKSLWFNGFFLDLAAWDLERDGAFYLWNIFSDICSLSLEYLLWYKFCLLFGDFLACNFVLTL